MNRELLQVHIRSASDVRPHNLRDDVLNAAKGIGLGIVIGWIMWAALVIGIIFFAGVMS